MQCHYQGLITSHDTPVLHSGSEAKLRHLSAILYNGAFLGIPRPGVLSIECVDS